MQVHFFNIGLSGLGTVNTYYFFFFGTGKTNNSIIPSKKTNTVTRPVGFVYFWPFGKY